MSCPNAPAKPAAEVDCVDGMVPWRNTGERVPCGWCWRAAGYDPLEIRQADVLLAWRQGLDRLTGPTQLALVGDDHHGPEFDRLCDRVRGAGITDQVRDAWLLWCANRMETT